MVFKCQVVASFVQVNIYKVIRRVIEYIKCFVIVCQYYNLYIFIFNVFQRLCYYMNISGNSILFLCSVIFMIGSLN